MSRGTRALVLWLNAAVAGMCAATELVATAPPCTPMPLLDRPAAAPPAFLAGASRSLNDSFAIASLNMAADPRIADVLAKWTDDRRLDVLLLQEVGNRDFDGAAFATSFADRIGYHLAYAPATLMGDTEAQGLAIVSREPLRDLRAHPLAYHHLRFRSRCRVALAATVATARGDVRVVNVHLDTRINSQERVAQLAPALDALGPWAGPQLIAGDFNTMPVYWWRTMWPLPTTADQSDAVRARLGALGFHTPFVGARPTLKLMGLPIHLDWIYLKQLEAEAWDVDDVPITDHRGVWARVKLALPTPLSATIR